MLYIGCLSVAGKPPLAKFVTEKVIVPTWSAGGQAVEGFPALNDSLKRLGLGAGGHGGVVAHEARRQFGDRGAHVVERFARTVVSKVKRRREVLVGAGLDG